MRIILLIVLCNSRLQKLHFIICRYRKYIYKYKGETKIETKTKDTKNRIDRDKFIDFSRFMHPKKWTQEDFALYTLVIFIVAILIVAVINIGLFGAGNSFTNQTFFGHTVNGKTGTVVEGAEEGTAAMSKNGWYVMAWIILFAALIASVCQFTSNIFMTKFSKRFIWFNQISMGIWFVIDCLYGVWWIMLTQIVGLVLAQIRFAQWDKADKDETVDPYQSSLNAKYIMGTFVALAVFFVVGMLLITTVTGGHEMDFYKYGELYNVHLTIDIPAYAFSQFGGITDKLNGIGEGKDILKLTEESLLANGLEIDHTFAGEVGPIIETKLVGPLYDGAPWFDLTAGVFQIGGLIVINKKSWIAWAMWEVAEIGMIVSFAKAGNMIMVVQNILLFVSNLIPLTYWFMLNHRSAVRVKQGIPYKAS